VIVRIHFGSTISAGKTFFMSNSKGIQHSKHLLEMKCNAMQKKKKTSWSRREKPAGITDVKYFPYWSVNLELIKAALPWRHW